VSPPDWAWRGAAEDDSGRAASGYSRRTPAWSNHRDARLSAWRLSASIVMCATSRRVTGRGVAVLLDALVSSHPAPKTRAITRGCEWLVSSRRRRSPAPGTFQIQRRGGGIRRRVPVGLPSDGAAQRDAVEVGITSSTSGVGMRSRRAIEAARPSPISSMSAGGERGGTARGWPGRPDTRTQRRVTAWSWAHCRSCRPKRR
jgi:hypothetical protein